MPAASRKATADAVVHQTSPLCRLPPDVLHRILVANVTAKHLALCKEMLPRVLRAIFSNADIYGAKRLAQFACSIKIRPSNARFVRDFTFSDASRLESREGRLRWDPSRAKAGAGQLAPSIEALEEMHVRSYRPDSMTVGFGLLKDVLRLLPNLATLALCGTPLIPPIFAPDYLDTLPFPKLEEVSLMAVTHIGEDWDDSPLSGSALNLASLKSMKRFSLVRNDIAIPFDRLNLMPSVALPPRSWHLEEANLSEFGHVGPESAVLFSALSESLRKVTIESATVHERFFDDLTRLPPSLEDLDISVGTPCSKEGRVPHTHPKLSSSIDHLVNLRRLQLVGDVIETETFETIASLPNLVELNFGVHTALASVPLLEIVGLRFSRLPKLAEMHVDICCCGQPSSGCQLPQWPPAFNKTSARLLASAAKAAGINL
ncbi:Proteophosphoglycan ppg4 [Rhodotorula toruloides]|nr:Proteophosphoglycan ppg4 [Rhodotorula toruloides]